MRDNKLGCLGFVLVVFLIIGVIIFSASASYNEHTYTVTITDKERVYDKDSSKYLVFGEDVETGETRVFQNKTKNVSMIKIAVSIWFSEKMSKPEKQEYFKIPIHFLEENLIAQMFMEA